MMSVHNTLLIKHIFIGYQKFLLQLYSFKYSSKLLHFLANSFPLTGKYKTKLECCPKHSWTVVIVVRVIDKKHYYISPEEEIYFK
jgi:hypothetical protein